MKYKEGESLFYFHIFIVIVVILISVVEPEPGILSAAEEGLGWDSKWMPVTQLLFSAATRINIWSSILWSWQYLYGAMAVVLKEGESTVQSMGKR